MNKMNPNRHIALVWGVSALFLASGCHGALGTAATPAAPTETIVSLTFDDGDADNFASADLLNEYSLRATWYIPSALVGAPGYMGWDQLLEMHAAGHEIGGHGLDHVKLVELQEHTLRRQVCEDRAVLQGRGFEPVSFAYPFGAYDEAAKRMVQECGYSSARTIGAGPDSVPPLDPFALRAYPYIVSDTTFSKLQRYVSGTRKEGGGWLILIFHHVCDDCDYFSVRPEVLHGFIPWLAEEQAQGHIKVRTIGEVVLEGSR